MLDIPQSERQIRRRRFHKDFLASKRPHLLMITNHGIHQWDVIPGLPDTGGQNVFVNQMTHALVRAGFKVTIVNRGGYLHPNTGLLRRGLDYQDELQRILYVEDDKKEFVRKEDMNEQLPKLAENLEQYVIQEDTQVDLIISHYWDGAKLGLLLNQRLPYNQKHIWIPHSLGALKKRNVDRSTWESLRIDERIEEEKGIVKTVDDIAATSSVIRDSLKNDYEYDTDLFLPPCVNPRRFHPADLSHDSEIWCFFSEHSRLKPEEIKKRRIITEISRTDDTKKKDILIRAFARMHEKAEDSLLVVSIDDNKRELAQKLRGLISELKVEDDVIVVGSVWDVLPKIYAASSVYCTPSVMEGFGMSVEEAAATGVPAVASDLVPFAVEHLLGREAEEVPVDGGEKVRRGDGVIVVPANSVEGFAGALEILLSDDSLRREMGRKAYNITIPHFTWENLSTQFLKSIGIELKPVELQIRFSFSRDKLKGILRNENIERLDRDGIIKLAKEEPDIGDYRPEKRYQVDPRNGDRILYSLARARRPHESGNVEEAPQEDPNRAPSIISKGKTTGAVDVADLSQGFTFINFNLFPVVCPDGKESRKQKGSKTGGGPEGKEVSGCHFLQWTSSYQDRDWHNMPVSDCKIVMRRLGKLEKVLLSGDNGGREDRYVSIIKNHGRLVGGSIAHGHQQIVYANVMPRRNDDLVKFREKEGKFFSAYMQETNPPEFTLRDYGPAVLAVPYFMRRPYDMMLLVKDTEKSHIFELNDQELEAVAQGWHDASRAMHRILLMLGREVAFNVTTANGPGAGLFFEFLPYSQECGGYEQIGLYICQASPGMCTRDIKEILEE
ncbi:MAG: glycosyltransferase [Kiritimatiellia bacterium]